jgi:phage-related tail protein
MASLSITTGPLTRSKSAADAKANALLADYADSLGATGTNAQRIDAVLVGLVRHMQEQARRHRRNTQTVTALAAIESELNGLAWE